MSERASYFDKSEDKGLITSAPRFIRNNIHYEVIMGSFAYGVTSDTSDMDVYGFCIPPKDMIFPHLRGEIQGFGKKDKKRFEQFQQHKIMDADLKNFCLKHNVPIDITLEEIEEEIKFRKI